MAALWRALAPRRPAWTLARTAPLATRASLLDKPVRDVPSEPEVLRFKRPRFSEQPSARAVLDLVDLYRPLLEHCDLAAAFFSVCRLSRRQKAEQLLAAEPRFAALIEALRAPCLWRRADIAAVWRGTAYISLCDEALHAVLRGAAARRAATFGARELANIFSGAPFIAPADAQLHGKLAKRATELAPQLSPKEIASVLHVLPELKPVPTLPALVVALSDAASASAPRFGADEVVTAIWSAKLLNLPRNSPLANAMLDRLPRVVLDMRPSGLRQVLSALKHYNELDSPLGKRVRTELDFKRSGDGHGASAAVVAGTERGNDARLAHGDSSESM